MAFGIPGIIGVATAGAAVLAAIAYVLGWYVIAQVLVGGVVVLLVYLLALLVMRTDRLVRPAFDVHDPSARVRLLDGYAPTAVASNRTWTSANVDARNYAPLTRSVNRRGGAQFTYALWMYIGDPSPANVGGKTILLRGSRDVVNWTKTTQTASLTDPKARTTTDDAPQRGVLVKCPLIRFGDTYDSLVVEFNTVHDPSARVAITPAPASTGDPTLRANLMKLAVNKWALHTFVFEDHVPISDFEDGVAVRYYLNDTLYHTGYVASTLVQNHGDLHLLPTSDGQAPLADCRIGDVVYYNHARTPQQVRAAYVDGPPTKATNDLFMGARPMPLVLSEFNRLDLYNTSTMA
jgi:hypothetical protein